MILQKSAANAVADPLAELLVLKKLHVVWDADKHQLAGVDLEQNQHLVHHQEETSFPRTLQPLGSVIAEQEIVCFRIFIVFRVNVFQADCDADAAQCTEYDVRDEQNLRLLEEELLVVPEPVDVLVRHVVQVDQVVLPVEEQVENLLSQNKCSEQTECEGIKVLFTARRSEDAKEANYCEQVEEDAGDSVIYMREVVPVVIVGRGAPVRDDAEREEVAVRAEEKVHVDARHVVPDKLIDDEVDELSSLKADEPLDLGAAFDRALVVDEPTNHKLGHQARLEANPNFLRDVAETVRVLLIFQLNVELLVFKQVDKRHLIRLVCPGRSLKNYFRPYLTMIINQ